MALEYGATVLAIELAHMRSLAEVELRLRRDIVEDLLSGTDEHSVVLRARGLRYDLTRPHRVVVVAATDQIDGERLFRAVRLAARNSQAGSLVVARADSVVLLANTDVEWEKLHPMIGRELGEPACRIGVGGRCELPRDFPRSYREARFALGLQGLAGQHGCSLCFDDLGVFRLLGQVADPADLRELATRWLDPLLRHDARRGSDYVETIAVYLECGGSHEQAAESLIVHRSTLKYRLRRIREISGYDLADRDTRFHLELATRAWRTMQTLGQPLTPPRPGQPTAVTSMAGRAGRQASTHDRLQTLQLLATKIVGSLDFDATLLSISNAAVDALNANMVGIMSTDDDRLKMITCAGNRNIAAARFEARRGEGVAGIVFETGSSSASTTSDRPGRYRRTFATSRKKKGIRAALGAPMLANGQVIGAVLAWSSHPAAFDEEDEEVLAGLANLAAIAIQNARLYESAREAADRLELANRALRQQYDVLAGDRHADGAHPAGSGRRRAASACRHGRPVYGR